MWNHEAERSTDRVIRFAGEAGLDISVLTMPQSTRTAEEAAAACQTSVGQIVKSLIFSLADNDEPILLLVSGSNRVHEKRVGRLAGGKLKRLDAGTVRKLTGFAIGGVAPLGSLTALRTFIDEDLLGYDEVWAAAGSPNSVFKVEPRALMNATGAKPIQMT